MKKLNHPEKRIHPRRPFHTRVVFNDEFGDGLFYVHSEDISLGGLLLNSEIPARTGSLAFLSFQLPPHKRPIHVTGEVIRQIKKDGLQLPAIGIRFVGLSEIARKRIEEFLNC